MPRIALAVFLLLIVVVCGPRRVHDAFDPSGSCVAVTVENRNFADVVVHVGDPSQRRRLGTVVGLSTVEFEVCRWQNVYARFSVHAIGGAFDLDLRAAHARLDPRSPLRVVVGVRPVFSHVVG